MSRSPHYLHGSPEQRFWSKVAFGPNCWEWLAAITTGGYGAFSAPQPGGKWRAFPAHRFAYMLTHSLEAIPTKTLVCHHCDNRRCVNPSHLFLGTHKENTADMMRKNRNISPPGEKNGKAVLNPEKVVAIRRELKAGGSYRVVGSLFGISHGTVAAVARGKTWRHVPD